jgi:hypothetical protein
VKELELKVAILSVEVNEAHSDDGKSDLIDLMKGKED